MVLTAAAAAQAIGNPALPPALAAAIDAYDKAQVQNDGRALGRLLADDYVLVNSAGQTETKAQFIADQTNPGFHLNPYVVHAPIVRVWRGGAVAGGLAWLTGTDGGKPFQVCLRFADVWSLRAGRWQVAYTQARRAEPDACKN